MLQIAMRDLNENARSMAYATVLNQEPEVGNNTH
jgi:hypothetical protein